MNLRVTATRVRGNVDNIFGTHQKQQTTFEMAGSWLFGKHHGLGKYTWKNGDVYIGNWLGGLMHGEGRMEWKSMETFSSSPKIDLRTGQVKFEWNTGGALKGNSYEGKPQL